MRRQLLLSAVAVALAACGPTSSAAPSLTPGAGLPEASVAVPAGWTRTLVPAFDGISTIGRVAAGDGGYVALSDFSAWHSTDGLAWSRIKGVGDQPRAIFAATGATPWIVGGWTSLPAASPRPTPMTPTCPSGPTATAQFATSADGSTWTVGTTDPTFETYVVGALAPDPVASGVWAVGANSCSEGLPPRSMSWRSANGTSWAPVPGTATDGLLAGLAAVGTRLVAVGANTDDPGAAKVQGLAWTMSTGGSAWSKPVAVPGAPVLGQVVGFDGTAYAIDRAVEPEVWTSGDLRTWVRTDFPGAGPRWLAVVTAPSGSWLAAASSDGIFGLRGDGTWVNLAGGSDTIETLTNTPTGLLAIGLSADGRGVVWQGPPTAP